MSDGNQQISPDFAKLQSAKDYAELLIQTANALVIGLDLEGRITVFNHAAELITGYTFDEMRTQNWFETLVPKDRYPEVWAEFTRLSSGGFPEKFENPILTKSGQERHILWQNSQMRDETGIIGSISFGIDITERKKAEAEQKLHSLILNTMTDGVYIIRTSDFKIVYTNPKFDELFGYGPGELIGQPVSVVNFEDGSGKACETANNIIEELKRCGEWKGEVQNVKKNGSTFWSFATVKTFQHPEHGEVWVSIHEDITERKQVEETLRLSEERLRHTLDGMLEGCQLIGFDWRYLYLNDSAVLQGRIPRKELLGHTMMETFPGLENTEVFATLKQVMEERKIQHIEHEFVHPGGSKSWFELSVQPVDQGIFILSIDITKRKKAEMELVESRARLRSIIDAEPECVKVLDAQGRLLEMNPAGLRIIEADSFAQVQGHFVYPLVDERDRDAFIALTKRVFEGQTGKLQFEIVGLKGSRKWLETNAVPLYDPVNKSKINGLLGITRDITLQKRMESELREAIDAAEKANQTKDLFLATLSHELRTPLTAILTWSQLIKSRKLEAGATQRGIEVIEQSALAQSRLINDLLDVSRIAAGKLSLDSWEISPIQIITSDIELISSAAAEKQIEIIQDLDPTVTTVFADPARLHQILWNLLGNALKFTPRGGKIWITLRRTDGLAEFIVRDNGMGIVPEFLNHIFERFSQADSSSTRSYGGLGLGLAISSSLVKMMGGMIKAESQGKGMGATFTFQLPIRAVALQGEAESLQRLGVKLLAATKPTPEELNQIKGTKVLVVDDDLATLEAVTVLLESFGAIIRRALSAKEALEILTDFTPDLIISDIAMPEVDGYGLLKKIRGLFSEKFKSTPVVALTAYAGPEDEKRATEAGFQGYLSKPVDVNVLLRTVVKSVKSES